MRYPSETSVIRDETKRQNWAFFFLLFSESTFSRGPSLQITVIVRESFPSAFPPFFHATIHYTVLETESTKTGWEREREKNEWAFVPLCARLWLLVKKKYHRDNVSLYFATPRLHESSQFISLLLLLSLSRDSVGFLSFLSLFSSLRPHFASLARAKSDGITKKESFWSSRPTAAGLLQRQRGVIMVTLSADSACGENRYFPHFVFREARACPICPFPSPWPLYERAPQLGCVVLDAETRARDCTST